MRALQQWGARVFDWMGDGRVFGSVCLVCGLNLLTGAYWNEAAWAFIAATAILVSQATKTEQQKAIDTLMEINNALLAQREGRR